MKLCRVCKIEKPIVLFDSDKSRSDGHARLCKQCAGAYSSSYYKKHKERIKARAAKWALDHPEQKAAQSQRWADAHRPLVREIQKRWRDAHRIEKPPKPQITEKRCTQCSIVKPASEFYKNGKSLRSSCKECGSLLAMSWRRTRPDLAAAAHKRWREKNPEKAAQGNKRRKERWQAANPGVSAIRAMEWYRANTSRSHANAKAQLLRKINAIPTWANLFFIEEAYDLSRRRSKVFGFKWHVDHIVPLRSKLVCGLHVENNLRVIPGKENLQKSNRYWPDMPEANHG